MRLIFASLAAVLLLCAGLAGHVRTVQAESDVRTPVSSLPKAPYRAAQALDWLGGGTK
jgi:hypothetical protein